MAQPSIHFHFSPPTGFAPEASSAADHGPECGMSMTGKERAALRAEAHHLNVQVHVGHQGLTPTLLQSVDDVLRTHLLVKLQVAKAGELSAKEAAQQIAEAMGADVIQVIGRTCTIFRDNPDVRGGDLPPWRR